MTRNLMVFFAAGGSAALMAGAFIFQALGYPPCAMCLWQRYPHVIAIVIGLMAWKIRGTLLPILGALSAATTGAIGFFHMGVERDWWEGPSSCTGNGGLDGLDGAGLLAIEGPKVIMCDQVSWAFLSLSMPTWNGIFSFILVGFWIAAIKLNGVSTKANSFQTG